MGTWRTGTRLVALVWLLGSALLPAPSPARAGALLDLQALRDTLRREAERVAQRYAPERMPQPPAWAERRDPPLATIAVLADPHYDDTGRREWTKHTRARLLKAIRYLNSTIKPQKVVLLGDLIASGRVDQLRRVKRLLDQNLAAPCCALRGNHDGPEFEAVFGPSNTSVAVRGVRLIALGLTYVQWASGWGGYDRLDWLARELAAHPREPTLLLTHNPVVLPTFANNAAVLRLLDTQPQVLGVLAGHLHVDYEMRLAKVHVGVPMLARPPHAFKVLRVHPDAILLFTYEEKDGAYAQAPVYQKLDIPPPFRLRAYRASRP